MNKDQASRFKDAVWFPKEDMDVIVGGAGGIGSWLTFLLCRLCVPQIYVYDFDILEEHNMSGQLYGPGHIGMPKVSALSQVCKQLADHTINAMNEKVTADTMATNFMFGAFDNMVARKDIFTAWKGFVADWLAVKAEVEAGTTTWEEAGLLPYEPIYIDGRLTLEQIQIFCVTPDRIEEYESVHLFDDSKVEEVECTLKQTSHTAAMIGGKMVGLFTNHLENISEGDKARTLPFLYQWLTPACYSSITM